jgi:poly(3-hydroxybutyrate) depolymerase
MRLRVLFFLWTFAAAFANATTVQGFDVSKAWEGAVVYVPSHFFPKRINDVKADAPQPVVILLHGCGGIDAHERRWADHLKSQGFIVVLPDSLAIPGRTKNCDSTTHTPNMGNIPVNDLRPAEAAYAMARVREQTWADQDNIFLMGHSEGGMGAYLTPELGFRGVIVSGFICSIPGGLRAERTTPVLAINWEVDPWFVRPGRPYQQCADRGFWPRRSNARQLVLPGQGHATAFETAARDAVGNFLKEFRK